MPDTTIPCVTCGRTFVWTEGEQRFYHKQGFEPPKHCKTCRSLRKLTPRSGPLGIVTYHWKVIRRRQAIPTRRRWGYWWSNPLHRFTALTLGMPLLVTTLATVTTRKGGLPCPPTPFLTWLLVLNLVAFAAYGYDKLIARTARTRIPEGVLLAQAFFGGSLGALLAMLLFHHKTAKASFRFRYAVVAVMHLGIVGIYLILATG